MLKYIPTAILIAVIAGIISVNGGYSVWEWQWWAFFLPLMILYFIFRDTGKSE